MGRTTVLEFGRFYGLRTAGMFENSLNDCKALNKSGCDVTTDQAVSRKTSLTLEELEDAHIHRAALQLKP